MTDSAALPRQTHKHLWVAITLQCVPLLAFAAFKGSGWFLISLLFWGLGYAYLGQTWRWVGIGLIGPVFVLFSLVIGFLASGFDHPIPDSNAGAIFTAAAIVIVGAVLVLSVDAWRTTLQHNAALAAAEHPRPESPA